MTQTIAPHETRPTASATSLAERARALAPGIAERAVEVEEQRHVHDDSIAELLDSGIMRALQPARYGGGEAAPSDFVEAAIEIGKACTSTSWVLCILGVHYWELSHMTQQAQDDVLGEDPATLMSSAYARTGSAERVEGGYILNGRWRSSSGVHHATWSIVGVAVDEDEVTRTFNFLIPLSEATIIDDWHVLGLCGTGSRTIVVENLFVPEHRTIDREILLAKLGPGLRENTAPLYQMPQGVIYSATGGAPALGAAYSFIDEFSAQAKPYRWRGEESTMTEYRPVLLKLAEHTATLKDQQRSLKRHNDEALRKATVGEPYTALELAQAIYDISRTAKVSLDVAHSLMPYLSAGVVYRHNPLQRKYRDMLTARQHNTQNVDLTGATVSNLVLGNSATSLLMLTPEQLEVVRQRAERAYGA